MPDLSSISDALAADGHQTRGWLFLFDRGAPVAVYTSGSVNEPPWQNLPVTLSSGSAAAVKHGMLYEVYTPGGLYKGTGRIRYAGTISTTNLPVRETGPGEIDLKFGDVIRVYRYWLPSDKLVGATADFNPDGLSYSDQGSHPPPVVNDNGAWAGFPSQLPFPLTGSLSYTVDPDSVNSVTHNRTLPSGLSFDTGDATTTDVTITGDPGTYWIEDVGTDPDNGKTTTRYTPVCISNTPLDCTIEPYGGNEQDGWRMQVNVRAAITENTWAAFVEREIIDGTEGSYGAAAAGRSHIKFLGVVRRLSVQGEGRTQRTSYEFVSPLAWLAETPGFSKVMLNEASPASWAGLYDLRTKRTKLQIIQFYSNYNEIGGDIIFNDNYRDKPYPGIFLEKNTPITQLRELADGVGAKLVNYRGGRFEFTTRLNLIPLEARASVTMTLAITPHMIIDYAIQMEMKDTVEKLWFLGFTAGHEGNAPFRIACPSKAPGTGTNSPQLEKMICNDIDDAMREAGRRYGIANQVYVNSAEQRRRAHSIELTLFGSLDVFDMYGEWITLPALANDADIDTTAFRYELDSILGVEFVRGTKRVKLRLNSETHAPPGQYDPPDPEPPPPSDYPWDWEPPENIGQFPVIGRGTNRMAVVCVNNVFLTANFQNPSGAGGPTYFSSYSKPWGGTLLQWVPNGFNAGSGWIITTTQIGYLTLATGTYVVKHTFAVATNYRSVDASFAENGFIAVISYDGTQGTTCCSSTNNSAFTEVVINASTLASLDVFFAGCNISSKTNGRIVAGVSTGDGTSAAYISNTYGASWSAISPTFAGSVWGYGTIIVPWLNNPSDNSYYYARAKTYSYSTDQHGLFRRQGGTDMEISPVSGGENYAPIDIMRSGTAVSTLNANQLLMVGRAGGAFGYGAFLTSNALAATPTWTTVLAPGGGVRRCALSGDDANTGWLWGVGILKQFEAVGSVVTTDDRMGNLASLTPGEIIAIAGF